MLVKSSFVTNYLKSSRTTLSNFSEIKSKTKKNKKKGNIYVKSTSRNIFCTLMEAQNRKIKTSCSLRVPEYENEFNERVNLFKRGVLLGELFGVKILELGFTEVAIYLDSNINKGRKGVLKGIGKKKIKVSFIQLLKGYPHNGCRPPKIRRKKVRTKLRK